VYDAICTDLAHDWKLDLKHLKGTFDDLKKVQEAFQADADAYYKDLKYCVACQPYISGNALTQADQSMLEQRAWAEVKPVRPSPLLLIDDSVPSQIFSNAPRNHFTQLFI
jgi:hypothetical protein